MIDSNNSVLEGEVKDLVVIEDKEMTIQTGWLNKASKWEDFITLWLSSKEIDNLNQFFKGDIADRVCTKYGESGLTKFAQETKEPYQTIVAYRRVSRAFKDDMRALDMSWTHYLLASQTDEYNKGTGNFKSDHRVKWIEKAHDNSWSVNQLAVEIKKEKALIKDTIFTYYSNYLDKIENILMHLDKSQLNHEQQEELSDRVYKIADAFDGYLGEI